MWCGLAMDKAVRRVLFSGGRIVEQEHGSVRRIFSIPLVICLALMPVFSAGPARADWDRFQIVEWQARDTAYLKALRRLGVTAAVAIADRGDGLGRPLDQQIAAPRSAGLRWYIENIATDFYAAYHRYTPGKVEQWRFIAAQERYRAAPDNLAALYRDPSLLDPIWRDRIRRRIGNIVTQQKSYKPLYYSLGDETGIADLAAAFDFDFSPRSVEGFRAWSRSRYGTLAALNKEWNTVITGWDQIEPETTQAALQRTDGNYAAWSDFKAWMDTQFADALRFGVAAVRAADPLALTGIEGAQPPGWGGYDYSKLANVLDVMEIYDSGENLPLLRAFSPRTIPLATSFSGDPAAIHAIWRSVLRGVKGLILWDPAGDIVGPDGAPAPRGQAYAPVFAALHGDVGRHLLAAEPLFDSVAILYSPASFRVSWLLERKADGGGATMRTAEDEFNGNAWRASLTAYAQALARIGLRPRFITPEQLSAGPPPERVLILPRAIALSLTEVRSIAHFAGAGGVVFADTPPGLFDEHGKPRPVSPLQIRIVPPEEIASQSPVKARFAVDAPDKDVETWMYRAGRQTLLALHRARAAAETETVTLHLGGWRARDLTHGRDLPAVEAVTLHLDGVAPLLLEVRQ